MSIWTRSNIVQIANFCCRLSLRLFHAYRISVTAVIVISIRLWVVMGMMDGAQKALFLVFRQHQSQFIGVAEGPECIRMYDGVEHWLWVTRTLIIQLNAFFSRLDNNFLCSSVSAALDIEGIPETTRKPFSPHSYLATSLSYAQYIDTYFKNTFLSTPHITIAWKCLYFISERKLSPHLHLCIY